MTDRIFSDLLAIATGIIGLAIFAVILGKNSQTSTVIGALGKALSDDITAAVKPVS